MSTCEDQICAGACNVCAISICSESATNCQSQQCDPGCSNAQCSGSQCQCGSSRSVILPILMGIVSIVFVGILGVGVLGAFGSKGPYILTVVGSIGLAFNLSGFRIDNNPSRCPDVAKTRTRWGWFVFIHSHHAPSQRVKGHEFKIGEKFFCTGCYGILLGVILSLLIAFFYLGIGLPYWMLPLVLAAIPLCFIPIIMRYTLYQDMSILSRLISNILLPVGICLLFVIFDVTSQGLINNILLIIGVITIAILRVTVASRSNQDKIPVIG